jgi:hypothetical protein
LAPWLFSSSRTREIAKLAVSAPNAAQHHMRVGIGYLD